MPSIPDLVINSRLWKHKEWLLHLLYWLFHFTATQVFWDSNWMDRSLRLHHPAPLSVLLFPLFFYANALWLIPTFLNGKRWYLYFVIGFGFVLAAEGIRASVFALAMNHSGDFISDFWLEFTSNDNLIVGLPNSMWFAYMLSFAYRFTKDWIINQQVIEQLKTEKMAMELNLLRSQMNPHFLFNNLNALDDLIDRDQELAKQYLHKLSSIYRYSTVNMQEEVVPLHQEWTFMEDYLYLLAERFGAVYQFEKSNELGQGVTSYLIPPASLQVLIENVVKHNYGTEEEPLIVHILANDQGICVHHSKRLNHRVEQNLGTGLANLTARFQLLSDQHIQIEDTDSHFSVTLPLIKQLT